MNRFMKATAALMLMTMVVLTTGCHKEDNAAGDGTIGGHSYVDFGFPSGTLWAACNIGARTPEAYGYYFAWGETEPQVAYGWGGYKYANGSYNKLTKYSCIDDEILNINYGNDGFIDNLTVLQPEDDPATVNWGSKWSTPTREQWDELCTLTTQVWTSQNGVKGCLFSRPGASLFLPAAGSRGGDLYGAGDYGFYWSSSLTQHSYYARAFYSKNSGVSVSSSQRCYGLTVRPVCSSQK